MHIVKEYQKIYLDLDRAVYDTDRATAANFHFLEVQHRRQIQPFIQDQNYWIINNLEVVKELI